MEAVDGPTGARLEERLCLMISPACLAALVNFLLVVLCRAFVRSNDPRTAPAARRHTRAKSQLRQSKHSPSTTPRSALCCPAHCPPPAPALCARAHDARARLQSIRRATSVVSATRRIAGFSGQPPGLPHADASMEPRRRPEYNLEIFADAACVKDVVKGTFAPSYCSRHLAPESCTSPPPPCPPLCPSLP